MYYEKDVKGAIIEYETAIELNPNDANAHSFYAVCLGFMDKITDSIAHAMIAQRLEPFSLTVNVQVCSIFWMAEFYEKAIEHCKKLIELEPNFYGGYLNLGLVYVSMNRLEEAIVQMELAVKRQNIGATLGFLGLIHGLMGEKIKAMEV